jgi:hypothetical protein
MAAGRRPPTCAHTCCAPTPFPCALRTRATRLRWLPSRAPLFFRAHKLTTHAASSRGMSEGWLEALPPLVVRARAGARRQCARAATGRRDVQVTVVERARHGACLPGCARTARPGRPPCRPHPARARIRPCWPVPVGSFWPSQACSRAAARPPRAGDCSGTVPGMPPAALPLGAARRDHLQQGRARRAAAALRGRGGRAAPSWPRGGGAAGCSRAAARRSSRAAAAAPPCSGRAARTARRCRGGGWGAAVAARVGMCWCAA